MSVSMYTIFVYIIIIEISLKRQYSRQSRKVLKNHVIRWWRGWCAVSRARAWAASRRGRRARCTAGSTCRAPCAPRGPRAASPPPADTTLGTTRHIIANMSSNTLNKDENVNTMQKTHIIL